jgi:hypothetical protein
MKPFAASRLLRIDFLLLLLSIGLAIYIYSTPSIVVGHMDWKGDVNGYSSRGTVFILPAIALFVYIVFNALEKNPSFLIKGEGADDPKVQASTLLYWRILKLLCLFTMDSILIVSWIPRIHYILVGILALFVVYNIVFLFKTQQHSK